MYMPPDNNTHKPAITRKGNIVHFSHPFFMNYHKHAQVPMKAVLKNILADMLPEPVIKVENMPSFARVTVTEQANRRMIYLMSYVPEKRGEKIEMIEEAMPVIDAKIAVRFDGLNPKRVYLAPEGEKLTFTVKDNYVSTAIPVFKGYAVIVFEI
jgi:hypothetical protein